MKKIILASAVLLVMFFIAFYPFKSNELPLLSIGTEENPNARDDYEFLMVRDPKTNAVPPNIRLMERQFAKRIPTRESFALSKGLSLQKLEWTERGPYNVGGRTRTFAADVEHPGILIAGGVDGGIWKSTDDGVSWKLKLQPQQIHSTSCISQDTRVGKRNVWYVGTGEFRGSTTNNTRWGSFYHGDGIYKSIDDGETWIILPSTTSGTPQSIDAFDFVWNIAANPADSSQDQIFAATWNGIYRSSNGGTTWDTALVSDPGTVNTSRVSTEIAITSSGALYAQTRESAIAKIWRSTDGINWANITPASFPTGVGRVVFTAAPSNTNDLFVVIAQANNTPAMNGHQLWKYTYNQSGGSWENRSANLPAGFDSQSGYDLILHVKPDDKNVLLLGGTNLYRTTDAFTTNLNTTTIGGYPYWPNGPHHPDLQSGMFKPTNSNIYYSGNDGGVQRSDDILMIEFMAWTSLNNGYNVTQLYSVSISPDSGDDAIVAGAQDNGTQYTGSKGMSSWSLVSSGDGTVCELAPVSDDRIYTQSQSGPLMRQTRTNFNYAPMNPSGAMNQLFVNPIALDPSNSKILYYGAGKNPDMWSGIWRNDNAPIGTSAIGWNAILASNVGTPNGSTRSVSAIGVSTKNSPHVLYYGTTDGLVMRLDNADLASATKSNITPPGLNGGTTAGGFVRSIAVDPTNSNRAMVAFGNYNFKNLWLTTDGGSTWSDIEGNISGEDGPSVRWTTLVYSGEQLHVFIGTSIGVLMTNELKGDSTVWVQAAANEIGNVLISYMDYRESDRTLVVGTHGRGVFSTQIPNTPLSVKPTPKTPQQFVLEQNFPNPFNPTTTIRYTLPTTSKVKLRIFDVQGKEIAMLVNEEQSAGWKDVQWDATGFSSGIYFYNMQAGSFVETKKMLVVK